MRRYKPRIKAEWIYWCDDCNVPLSDGRCGVCSSKGRRVLLTPPGDVRPAFEHDIELIRSLLDEHFGDGVGRKVLPNGLVLLNKIPHDERADEVIVDGEKLATIYYDIFSMRWRIMLREEGAIRVAELTDRKKVYVDSGAVEKIKRGHNVMAPGVLRASDDIEVGDEVIICDPEGSPIAVGRARIPGYRIVGSSGEAVRTRLSFEPREPRYRSRSSWKKALEANEDCIESKVEDARLFIEAAASRREKKFVSFSGGKDSLVTLDLCLKTLGEIEVAFIDTGIEFPATLKYVHDLESDLGFDLVLESAGDSFWRSVGKFGPPGRDYRWCCKVCKLGPVTRLIEKRYRGDCLSFIGQRRYESDRRARTPPVWINPWVIGQLSASPIQDWRALDVWLYIFREGLRYNPLYEMGFHRIGCWLCPSSDLSELELVKSWYPDLWSRFEEVLEDWRIKNDLPREWIDRGFWRWRRLPPSRVEIARRLGIEVPKERRGEKLGFWISQRIRPCDSSGRIIMEGEFSSEIDIERAANFLRMLGEPRVMERLGVIKLGIDDMEAILLRKGKLILKKVESEERGLRALRRIAELVIRAMECVGCGVCISRCPNKALELGDDGRAWIVGACSRCLVCHERCPISMGGYNIRSA